MVLAYDVSLRQVERQLRPHRQALYGFSRPFTPAAFVENVGVVDESNSDWIQSKAKELGFDLCGIARASDLIEPEHQQEWLARGYAGEMRYLHDARRSDPARVLPEVRSIIVCAVNYNTRRLYSVQAATETSMQGKARGWISRYAWGENYHDVMLEKLTSLVEALHEKFGNEFAARSYVDTGPVAERLAAQKAGLGWLAKNTCLINQGIGSWLFLGLVLTSLDLATPRDQVATPPADLCGKCRRCLDACPTGALTEPYVMDARRCISYLTIELRSSIPEELRPGMGWQIFGCDICQDVCPWNRAAPTPETGAAPFSPRDDLYAPALEWVLSLSEEEFRKSFRRSAVRRTKWRGMLRNACVAAGNIGETANDSERARLRAHLKRLAAGEDEMLAEHANWALSRLERASG